MAIKRNDFVELEYTGRFKEDNSIFDTTDKKIAKENNLFNENASYGPIIVCVGQEQALKGIDDALIGRDSGEFKVGLKPENAFGNKDAKLIQLVPTSKFKQQKIQPMPGLQVNVDGIFGVIKTVSGGRTLVDFNHPLAGKELSYDIKVNRIVDDDGEKVKAFLKLAFGIKDCKVEIKEGNAEIAVKSELNEKTREEISKKITGLVKTVKKVEFMTNKEEKK